MGKTKSTKHFEKNLLKDTLKRRKEGAKIKQRHQVKEKLKARRARDNEREDAEPAKPEKKDTAGEQFKNMSVDEFFQGGFEVPEELNPKKKSKKSKDAPTTTGKRKRTEAKEETDSEDESSEDDVEEFPIDASGSEADSESDEEDYEKTLEALKTNDPKLYAQLQKEDEALFNNDFKEVEDLSEAEEEETPKKKRKTSKKSKAEPEPEESEDELEGDGNEVSKAMVDKWDKAMADQHSLRAMKEVVLAFRAAAHLNEEDGKQYKYSVSNPDVYHKLIKISLELVPKVLEHHLPPKKHPNGKISLATDSKKYRTLTPLLKSHISSVHHLLDNLSDAATLGLTLKSIVPLLPYILSFKKVVRDMVKTVVVLWSSSSSIEATRILAFLILRQLVVIGDPGIKESVLKSTYQGFVKGARNTTVHTIKGINLMKNSAAELWGLDSNVGYATGFTFIRQLAIHLRTSITQPTKDSYKAVYNWQYVHSLDFWSRVLSEHCASLKEAESGKESPLRPLIYPTVQVTMGALRLIPTSQYFPLRFQLIRSLLRLSRATTTYIPLAPALYEVLTSAEMKKSPKNSTLKPLDFATNIRAPKLYLKTRVYQDGLGEQVVELLSEFFVLWCKNIAFPELALPVVVMLKRWIKDASQEKTGNRNGKVNAAMKLIVQKLEANARFVEEKRAKVEFAPRNRAGVEGFLKELEWEKTPLGAFVTGQRKSRADKEKVLEDGRQAEERKRLERKAKASDEKLEEGGGGVVDAQSEDEDEDEDESD
ncbi:hypothetical protein EG328_011650 [Venturia inaequalis]|uniref:Ribosome assembly protein Noc2 n=1 Tax=Venturia inaequalis TaxID=5025 RepID=A0A8H3VE24_VENIN|nr:hypothetical protein EG328_011650 [Venturia inaequalis]KAE9994480.1 hypothetical protein EG327_009158 [Venturia inaequalis]RDI86313.1 hypothetical protein Vi05172_g3910 [Venturia inaequalis]